MKTRNLLAFDLGASNGRAMLARFDGERMTLTELHRFENSMIEQDGAHHWDVACSRERRCQPGMVQAHLHAQCGLCDPQSNPAGVKKRQLPAVPALSCGYQCSRV